MKEVAMETQQDIQAKEQESKSWPKVSIIVLNWNGWKYTIECLESIYRINYPNYQVIVVDNASTDGSLEKIKAWAEGKFDVWVKQDSPLRHLSFPPVPKPISYIEYSRLQAEVGGTSNDNVQLILIQTGANLGYAGGNNVGIRYALKTGAEYILILNNDTVIDKNALSEMIKMFKEKKKAGVIGPKLLYYHYPDTLQTAGCRFDFWMGLCFMNGWKEKDKGQWDTPYQPDVITGAAMLCSRTTFEQVGLMDESFFMYVEEIDWEVRVKKAGFEIWYCPQAKVWHVENASTGYKSPFVEYWSTYNNLRLVHRYYPLRLPVAIFFHLLRAVRRFAKGRFKSGFSIIKGIKGICLEVIKWRK